MYEFEGPSGLQRVTLSALLGLWILAAGWLLLSRGIAVVVMFSLLGGTQPDPVGSLTVIGLLMFAVGSWLNTYSEWQRYLWKARPENKGRLYTGGLFAYAMHINYFGDVVLFTGLALITQSWQALVVPVLMVCGFVLINIPTSDWHLAERYRLGHAQRLTLRCPAEA